MSDVRCLMLDARVAAVEKQRRISVSSSVLVAIDISPQIRILGKEAHISVERSVVNSFGVKPDLVSSCATCTSNNIFCTIPNFSASVLMACNNRLESTDSMIYGFSLSRSRTLLVCRCPMKCHWISFGSCVTFCLSSCTLLSPKCRSPAWYASCMACMDWNLLTHTSVTPAGICARTFLIFSDMRDKSISGDYMYQWVACSTSMIGDLATEMISWSYEPRF